MLKQVLLEKVRSKVAELDNRPRALKGDKARAVSRYPPELPQPQNPSSRLSFLPNCFLHKHCRNFITFVVVIMSMQQNHPRQKKRFFTNRSVWTSESSLEHLDTISRSRFVTDIKSIELSSRLFDWWKCRDPFQDNNSGPGHISTFSLYCIFIRATNLTSITIHTARHVPYITTSPNTSELPVPQFIKFQANQDHIVNTLFQAIRTANRRLESFQVISVTRSEKDDSHFLPWFLPALAPSIDALFNRPSEYSAFGYLRQANGLEHVEIRLSEGLAVSLMQRRDIETFSSFLLEALVCHPIFPLKVLVISGPIATCQTTLAAALRTHARTIRHLSLNEVDLRTPNS